MHAFAGISSRYRLFLIGHAFLLSPSGSCGVRNGYSAGCVFASNIGFQRRAEVRVF